MPVFHEKPNLVHDGAIMRYLNFGVKRYSTRSMVVQPRFTWAKRRKALPEAGVEPKKKATRKGGLYLFPVVGSLT